MAARTPLRDRPLAYIDTETTGLDPNLNEILDIAIVFDTYSIQKLLDDDAWVRIGLQFKDDYAYLSTRIKPQRIETAHPKALEVNGYASNPGLWKDAPLFDDVADKVAFLLSNSIPVGHNVTFDTGFITATLRRAKNDTRIDYHAIDTITLAYEHLAPGGLDRLNLDAVCDHLDISNEGKHAALVDALRAREVHHRLSRATFLHRLYWRLRRRWVQKRATPA